jgi:hypothetical protein
MHGHQTRVDTHVCSRVIKFTVKTPLLQYVHARPCRVITENVTPLQHFYSGVAASALMLLNTMH